MEKISFLNGKFLPHSQCFVHIEDRGFQFADSVYEVVLFKNNKLIDFDWHIQRLARSLVEMRIKFDLSTIDFKNIFLELFKKNNLSEGSVYLQITRGVHSRMAALPECEPTIISTVKEFDKSLKKQLSVVIHPDLRWGRCDIKSTALFASSLAKQNATDQGFDDVIMERGGFVTEISFANVFMVDEKNNLITPSLDQNILGGVTRNRIIDLAQNNGITTIERQITVDEILKAKEIFASSSTMLIRPIIKVNNKPVNNGTAGKITQKLIDLYNEFIVNC